jgi:hypothetical protein
MLKDGCVRSLVTKGLEMVFHPTFLSHNFSKAEAAFVFWWTGIEKNKQPDQKSVSS